MGAVADGALGGGRRGDRGHPRSAGRRRGRASRADRAARRRHMHERKHAFTDLSDGFLTLPGGVGTMDELWEAVSWAQLGYHAKPVGLLNAAGFLRPSDRVQRAHGGGRLRPPAASGHHDRRRRARRVARQDGRLSSRTRRSSAMNARSCEARALRARHSRPATRSSRRAQQVDRARIEELWRSRAGCSTADARAGLAALCLVPRAATISPTGRIMAARLTLVERPRRRGSRRSAR